MSNFGSYGVLQQATVPQDRLARAVEEVTYRGFAVVAEAIPDDTVASLNRRLDDVYAVQCEEVGGEAALLKLSDADIVRCPLAYDPEFLALAQHPTIIDAAKMLVGSNIVLLMQNGVINRPDRVQAQTRWHRDLNYQHWVCSQPLAMGALVCLEDFNAETGGTLFIPGSHKFPQMPSEELVKASEEIVTAPRGSILLFDSMAFHRAGLNRSQRIRRGVNHVIGAPILNQQIDIPRMLGADAPAEPWLAGYLGYRWNPAADVKNWRLQKLAQLRGRHQAAAGKTT
jgi:ectoine hydroxylase-related dioxygenase (phytanoyl-CoA dioxygenase family)